MNFNKQINNMLGKKLNFPKMSSIPSKKDWDGDGVPNKKDCQPRNPIRQDNVKWTKGQKKPYEVIDASIGENTIYKVNGEWRVYENKVMISANNFKGLSGTSIYNNISTKEQFMNLLKKYYAKNKNHIINSNKQEANYYKTHNINPRFD